MNYWSDGINSAHSAQFSEHTDTENQVKKVKFAVGGGPNEVWVYQHSDIITKIILLRDSIRDYVEYHLTVANWNGTPITRPMVYDFPDSECYNAEDQFMFGPDYLVAPVLQPNATSRSVYFPVLPNSQQWMHLYSKQLYKGGQRLNISVTLADFPVFQRF